MVSYITLTSPTAMVSTLVELVRSGAIIDDFIQSATAVGSAGLVSVLPFILHVTTDLTDKLWESLREEAQRGLEQSLAER